MFDVLVFLACRRTSPERLHGPGSLARLPYTLEGVSYTFRIDNPACEPPFHVGDVWFYLRFARTAPGGFTRRANDVFAATVHAGNAILLTTSDPGDLALIRRDFDRFRRLAKKHAWTDDTPVPPEVVGPLWPRGRVPRWAKDTSQSPA